MILNSIVIENIRSYEHEEVEFPRGISLFEGDIGSGKSTVLMSIEFALFGLGSQKPEALLSKKSDSGFVILEFSVDGAKYEIKRTLIRKNDSVNQDPKNSWIKIAGEKVLLSPSELKQKVLQILKFNEPADPKSESRIFRYAIFTPQEAMKEVLADSKRRIETIRKAFGIEDYSTAESNARELLSEIKTEVAVLQQKSSGISETESQIQESQKLVTLINEEISKNQHQNRLLKAQEDKLNSEFKELQNKNKEKIKIESKKENLEDKIKVAKSRIEHMEKEFAYCEMELEENTQKLGPLLEIKRPSTEKRIPEIISEIKKFQKINDEMIKLKSEKNSITQEIQRIKETLGEKINSDKKIMQDALTDLQHEKESLEKYFDEIKEKQEKINEQKIQRQTIKESLEKEIVDFSKLGNACPKCKQEITEDHYHDLVDEKHKEVASIGEELKSITDSFFETNSKLKEIMSKLESYDIEILQIQKVIPGIGEYDAKSAKLSEIEAKINELKSNFQDPEFEGKNPIEHLTELKDGLMQFESVTDKIKQIIEAKQRVERLIQSNQREGQNLENIVVENESELKQIESELENFEDIDQSISLKESELNNIRNEITRGFSMIAASEENLKNQTEKIKQNEIKISESRKWEKKYKKFIQFQEWLGAFFIPTISQIEKQVLLSILQNFNETYVRWYSILVEDPTKESRIDENFTPIVNQDGYEQEIGFLSGGEKTSIALAYRLTLNSLMRKETESMKSNLLILDEPTDGFSKNQLGKIREVLDELKSEQIVLVSHEKELETYVDNIFKISKENGLSKISKIN